MEMLGAWADRLESLAGPVVEPGLPEVAAAISREFTAAALLTSLGAPGSRLPRAPRTLDECLLAVPGGMPIPDPPAGSAGPVLARSPDDVIEVWTESELTIVHAGWRLPSWRPASLQSARWLLEEIQPDNATNLPWAVHVFAWLAVTEADMGARHYAETLLHNCVVMRGRPDGLSALILLDAARQLRSDQAG